jgi:hypothetical protein
LCDAFGFFTIETKNSKNGSIHDFGSALLSSFQKKKKGENKQEASGVIKINPTDRKPLRQLHPTEYSPMLLAFACVLHHSNRSHKNEI